MTEEQRRKIIESIRNQTDEEFDIIWNQMVEDGIIDEDGNVLKRFPPGPPDWMTGRNGQPKADPPDPPAKKARKPRKRA